MVWMDRFVIKAVVLIAIVVTILSFANHNYGGVALGILSLVIYLTIEYFNEKVIKAHWREEPGIKCIVSDFDYTLFLHDSPSETRKNLRAVRRWRKRGGYFIIASSRDYADIVRVLPRIHRYADYLILNGGMTFMTARGKIIQSEDLGGAYLPQMLFEEFDDTQFSGAYAVISYCDNKEIQGFAPHSRKYRIWFERAEDLRIAESILAKHFSESLSFFAYTDVRKNHDLHLSWINPSMTNVIEIFGKNASKENAILYNCSSSFIRNRKITTIGDDKNDIGMIVEFDGYALESAPEEVRSAAPDGHVVASVRNLIDSIL